MQFYVDNASSPFFTATPSILPSGDTWPFNQTIFTILNVAIGGTLGGSTSGLTNPSPCWWTTFVGIRLNRDAAIAVTSRRRTSGQGHH
jgi:hypothetical protein